MPALARNLPPRNLPTRILFSRSLFSRLAALVAAAAVTLAGLAGSATPARASDDALLKFLLGATAIAIIVHSASSARAQPPARGHAPPRGLPSHCRETLSIHGRHVTVYNARCLKRTGLRNLPEHCHETVRTNHGLRSVYRARCLERTYAAPRHPAPDRGHRDRGHWADVLPGHCRMSYRYGGQRHVGFDARCLHDAQLRNLPATCLVRSHGSRTYSGQCLREHGYRFR